MSDKFILDACCGGRMFWYNKKHPKVLYIDNRKRDNGHHKGRPNHCIKPDILMDFRKLNFPSNIFKMVVFDPPHLIGKETCNMTKEYGWLDKNNWKEDIKKGFNECWRVLELNGFLVFKWNEHSIKISEVNKLFPVEPLFGNRQGTKLNTHWLVFMKEKELEK